MDFKRITFQLGMVTILLFFSASCSPSTNHQNTSSDDNVEPIVNLQISDGNLLWHDDSSGDFQIYLQDPSSQNPIRLTNPPGSAVEPILSPNGEKIVFSAYQNDPSNIQIFIMNRDGSDRELLTPDQPKLNWRPAWSPDGNVIAFQSNRDGNFEIYVFNLKNSSVRNISSSTANDADPDWSAAGKLIVFTSNRDGTADIYQMSPDGSNIEKLLECEQGCALPKWSPQGDKIIFVSDMDGDGTNSLYCLNLHEGKTSQVTNRGSDDSSPRWINEDTIIFSGIGSGSHWDLFIVQEDGSHLEQLTDTPHDEKFPFWTP